MKMKVDRSKDLLHPHPPYVGTIDLSKQHFFFQTVFYWYLPVFAGISLLFCLDSSSSGLFSCTDTVPRDNLYQRKWNIYIYIIVVTCLTRSHSHPHPSFFHFIRSGGKKKKNGRTTLNWHQLCNQWRTLNVSQRERNSSYVFVFK